jgi:membrane-associated phospholipid phosphatase
MDIAANAISLSFLATIVGPIFVYARTGDAFYAWLVALVIAVATLVEGLKRLLGTAASWLQRPSGATACDIFCIGQDMSRKPGFPSGHMAVVAAFVASLWLHWEDPRVLYIGIPWVLAMAWARWFKRCHTWLQIAGGVAVGIAAAFTLDRLQASYRLQA